MRIFSGKLCLLLTLFNTFTVTASVLTKAFYHRGQCEDKIVFYFSESPKLLKHANLEQVVYEFSPIQVDQILLDTLSKISFLAKNYQISFVYQKSVLHMTINFSNQVVQQVALAKFKPISENAGVVIKILHRDITKTSAQQVSVCQRILAPKAVVLDFGHGGSDTGARFGKICEKDVVRKVGLKLVKMLEAAGYIVYLTREHDEFVALDERTYFANLQTNASLFLSLHANHAPNHKISGLETYHMSDHLFSQFDEDGIKNNFNLLNKHSASLANLVHANILQIKTPGYHLIDRKVKQAVSQVLLGVEMPAVLIELGFLSNSKEARQLNTSAYQLKLAQAIYQGVISYFAQL